MTPTFPSVAAPRGGRPDRDRQSRLPPSPDRACGPLCSEARCPRCGVAFHCGVADDVPCHCMDAKLTDAHRAALSARYERCLCAACLAAVAAGGAP